MLSISYQPTESDLIAAYRLHASNALRSKRTWVGFLIGALICALISGWVFESDLGLPLGALLSVIYWLVLLGLLIGIARLALARRVRRIFAQQKSLHGESTVAWSDESITFGSPKGMTTYEWSDFLKIIEDRNIILLMQSDALFNFVPKRLLSSDQAARIMA